MVTVIAVIYSDPARKAELEPVFDPLIKASRAEEACLQYDLHLDADIPGRYVFYERWRDAASLEQHNQTPHLRAFRNAIAPFLEAPVEVSRLILQPG